MTKFVRNLINITLALLLTTASTLTLITHYTSSEIDPITEITKLQNQSRRDDALDLVEFLKSTGTADFDTLETLENDLEYSVFERIKSFTAGAFKGEINNTWSGLGAISSDLCVYGDIRDIGIHTYRYFINAPNFDPATAILSGIGLVLSVKPLIHGVDSLAKNTVKYSKRISSIDRVGILDKFLKGKTSVAESQSIWNLFRKNDYSIPRTVTCLNNVRRTDHLETAVEIVGKYKRAGNAFINLAGDSGLFLYSTIPKSLRTIYLKGFCKNPTAVLGITTSHLTLHFIKIFHKYDLVSFLVPVVGLSLVLSLLPPYLIWIIFMGSTGYLAFTIFKKSKPKVKKETNKCLTKLY